MPARAHTPQVAAVRPRRADAQRNIELILDAAVHELAQDPEASMAQIARRAGVVRATLYVHFPTREVLIAAVTARALNETAAALRAARPDEGDPADALERVLVATWRQLGRYHALVQINSKLGPERLRALHKPVLGLVTPLLKRGQASGAFNHELPVDWMITTILELVHAASRELTTGRLPAKSAEGVLIDTVTGALAANPKERRCR